MVTEMTPSSQGRFTRPEARELDVHSPAFKIQAREIHEVAASLLNAVDTATLEKVAVADIVVRSKANFLMLRESLQDGDIPHRTKLRTPIVESSLKYYDQLKIDLKTRLGNFPSLLIFSRKGKCWLN
ncbi:hypothetical protein B0H14DRAFT_2557407 [Mycena olivaceomarginata]|nr:hypothetical protein B0H14DRAFT_2557407 [Mycena olivaceomarginata]